MFIDDIFVYCTDAQQHLEYLRIALETLREENFYVAFKKCEF